MSLGADPEGEVGIINRASDLALGEKRNRCAKMRQERCVDVTAEISRGEAGGMVKACSRGVTGAGSAEPANQNMNI